MSFFSTSDGAVIETDGKFESGGGDLPPIPKGTQVLASIDQAKWSEFEGQRYIDLRWTIARPDEYANRKIFQKVRVNDSDPVKRDKALRMLAAIDANAGGKLVAAGVEPTDEALVSSLSNRPMVLKLEVWELDDKSKSGNWIAQVAPYNKQASAAPANPMSAPQQPAPAPQPAPVEDEFDDNVPF